MEENLVSVHTRGFFWKLPTTFKEDVYERQSKGVSVVGEKEVSYKKWLFHRSKFDVSKCNFDATYLLMSKEGDVLYIGKAKNVSERVGNHLSYKTECNLFLDYVHSIILVKDASNHEDFYIKNFRPIFNTAGSDDSMYSRARSTIIPNYPEHKDTIIRQLILRDRAKNGNNKSEISRYAENIDIDLILDMMAIIDIDPPVETEAS